MKSKALLHSFLPLAKGRPCTPAAAVPRSRCRTGPPGAGRSCPHYLGNPRCPGHSQGRKAEKCLSLGSGPTAQTGTPPNQNAQQQSNGILLASIQDCRYTSPRPAPPGCPGAAAPPPHGLLQPPRAGRSSPCILAPPRPPARPGARGRPQSPYLPFPVSLPGVSVLGRLCQHEPGRLGFQQLPHLVEPPFFRRLHELLLQPSHLPAPKQRGRSGAVSDFRGAGQA